MRNKLHCNNIFARYVFVGYIIRYIKELTLIPFSTKFLCCYKLIIDKYIKIPISRLISPIGNLQRKVFFLLRLQFKREVTTALGISPRLAVMDPSRGFFFFKAMIYLRLLFAQLDRIHRTFIQFQLYPFLFLSFC